MPLATGAVGTCPACGGPLYTWTKAAAADARRQETYVLDRCEGCGLGIVREGELDVSALLASAEERGDGLSEVSLPNRRSLQAAIGGGTWAALELPDRQVVGTPQALIALLERQGHRVVRIRQPPFGPNLTWMWQTLMNALTFHPNFAREVIAGRLRPANSRSRALFVVDAVVSLLALPLVALAALLLETAASGLRRGGLVVAVVDRRPAHARERESSSTSSESSGAESS